MAAAPSPPVQHEPDARRFVLRVDGQLCECTYRIDDAGRLVLDHTHVPRALEGRGLAALLVAAALDHARAEGRKVRPVCSYVQAYMRRHPQTLDLLG